MYSLVLKFFVIFCCLGFFSKPVFAVEDAHGAAPKKEEGHGAAAPEAPKKKPREDSFLVVQARVAALEARVRSGESEIEKLIEEKKHVKDPEKLNEIIRQMINVHHEVQKQAKEYEEQRALLKYRYPEKGMKEEREYERIEVKPLEEIENHMTLSSALKRTMKKVKSQYPGTEGLDNTDDHLKKGQQNKHAPSLVEPVVIKK